MSPISPIPKAFLLPLPVSAGSPSSSDTLDTNRGRYPTTHRGSRLSASAERAAGGVVCDAGAVLVVHRPRYDDWSLPKGHLNLQESWEQAALREVREETGVRCAITSAPHPISYLIADRVPKLVFFYAMVPTQIPEQLVGDPSEVDEVAWWDIADAMKALSYEAERAVCAALAAGR